MSHAADRPESGDGNQETGNGRRGGGAASRVLPALFFVAALSALPGCGKPPTIIGDTRKDTVEKGKPWETAVKRLRKDTDPAACRTALNALNNELPNAAPETPKPVGLTPEAEEALAKLVPLSKEDRDEIRKADFTAYDSAYLAECLYLRDAARTVDLPARPGETAEQATTRRADAAFAWVCRQVYVNPWLIPVPGQPNARQGTALPPGYVLRRGYGSGLERMYVFLALLQQMGLDGCLVGPPDAGALPATFVATGADKRTVLTGAPRGPFWAAGVRVGNDVRLYDPWRGQAFPVPLGQLKSNPDAQKAWFEDKANVSGITPALAKDATVYLAVPVNSLAPRMIALEQQLKADIGVKLAVNAAALRDAFPDPKPALWNVPGDRFAYGRTARIFLPVDDGGTDRAEPGQRLFEQYLWSQLPPQNQFLPAELLQQPEVLDDVGERIVLAARSGYGRAFIHPPPTPRERLQRGQFQDASRDLVERRDAFARGLELLRNTRDADQQIKQWGEKAVQLYAAKGRALFNKDPDALAAAQAALDEHWSKATGLHLLLSRAVSAIGLAESTLLLALSKHEQAEHAQARLDGSPADAKLRQSAADAWTDALAAWQTYADYAAAQAGLPGRAAHVETLTARAEAMAPKK